MGDNDRMGSLSLGTVFPLKSLVTQSACTTGSLSASGMLSTYSQREIMVSYEAIQYWCWKFGSSDARSLRRRQGCLENIWYVDKLFVTIRGERHYRWRAVDHARDVIDISEETSALLNSSSERC